MFEFKALDLVMYYIKFKGTVDLQLVFEALKLGRKEAVTSCFCVVRLEFHALTVDFHPRRCPYKKRAAI